MRRLRQGLLALMLVLVLALETLPLVWAQEASPTASPVTGTPVASPAATPTVTDENTRDPGVTAAEQALADLWVPVAMLRTQAQDCSTEGEPYIPISVDITLNNPDVLLRQRISGRPPADDPIIMTGPSAADLVGLDSSYYLDLPGDSLAPGCTYETWSRERIAELGLTPSVYAHIASEPGQPGKLAVQYWFYYAFDSFNNSHESDWEMIQLTFDAYTPEQVLAEDLTPSRLSFAQHSGGENADITDPNVVIDDEGRIRTFPGQGSHASYYDSAIWLAWGEGGSGFGCDQSQVELTEVPLKAIVVPDVVDIHGEFAWTMFQGRWGEYHPWQFNAPISPNLTKKWRQPISWTDDLRSVSYAVPHHEAFGTGPGEFFCSLSTLGGNLAKKIQVSPQVIGAAVLAVFAGILFASVMTWRFVKRATVLYVRHARLFVPTSLLVLAVAALAMVVRRFSVQTLIGDWLEFDDGAEASMTSFFTHGGMNLVLYYLLLVLAAPWIIALTGAIVKGESTSFGVVLGHTVRRIPAVAGALLLNAVLVTLMFITIVLIPFGFFRQIQWFYSPHAIILDGAGIRAARNVSRHAIKGDWIRTFGMAAVISIISGIPGPLIGMVLVLTNRVSLEIAGIVSGVVFAIVYTIAIIASTLYYRWRQEDQAERLAEGRAATEGEEIRRKLRFWEDESAESPATAPPVATPRPEPA